MADVAHRLTDEKLEEMEKRLSAIYSRAEKEIGERWKESVNDVSGYSFVIIDIDTVKTLR